MANSYQPSSSTSNMISFGFNGDAFDVQNVRYNGSTGFPLISSNECPRPSNGSFAYGQANFHQGTNLSPVPMSSSHPGLHPNNLITSPPPAHSEVTLGVSQIRLNHYMTRQREVLMTSRGLRFRTTVDVDVPTSHLEQYSHIPGLYDMNPNFLSGSRLLGYPQINNVDTNNQYKTPIFSENVFSPSSYQYSQPPPGFPNSNQNEQVTGSNGISPGFVEFNRTPIPGSSVIGLGAQPMCLKNPNPGDTLNGKTLASNIPIDQSWGYLQRFGEVGEGSTSTPKPVASQFPGRGMAVASGLPIGSTSQQMQCLPPGFHVKVELGAEGPSNHLELKPDPVDSFTHSTEAMADAPRQEKHMPFGYLKRNKFTCRKEARAAEKSADGSMANQETIQPRKQERVHPVSPPTTKPGNELMKVGVPFDADGRTRSLNRGKKGLPHKCPKCFREFVTSQHFASHMGCHYLREETVADRMRRRVAKYKNHNLVVAKTRVGITLLPQYVLSKRRAVKKTKVGPKPGITIDRVDSRELKDIPLAVQPITMVPPSSPGTALLVPAPQLLYLPPPPGMPSSAANTTRRPEVKVELVDEY